MKVIKDGIRSDDRAFPSPMGEAFSRGMDLRTWLAGLAMQAMLTSGERDDLPYSAVAYADLLIEELNKPKEK